MPLLQAYHVLCNYYIGRPRRLVEVLPVPPPELGGEVVDVVEAVLLKDALGMILRSNATFETTCPSSPAERKRPVQTGTAGITAAELALPETAFARLQHPQHLLGRYGGNISGYTAFECSDRVAEE